MRYLMRLNAEKGWPGRADVDGYYVGGKTSYSGKGGRWPVFQNQAVDELHRRPSRRQAALSRSDHDRRAATHSGNQGASATSGWNAAPVAGLVIARVAPLLGIQPRFDLPPADRLILPPQPRRADIQVFRWFRTVARADHFR